MTREEAIEKLEWLPIMRMPDDKSDLHEALAMAIEALKKQTPKKPIYKEFLPDTIPYFCPSCNKKNFDDGKLFGDFCPYCGQALDWK